MTTVEILWPYTPGPGKPLDQVDVVVTLEDGTRWLSSFYDTHRFNKSSQAFRGLGPEQPFRFQKSMIIVRELSDASVGAAVDSLIASGDFAEAFEQLDVPAESD